MPAPYLQARAVAPRTPATVDSLQRRQAEPVSDGFIEDYVALHWLEWSCGGALRLTVTGTDMCEQMRARLS